MSVFDDAYGDDAHNETAFYGDVGVVVERSSRPPRQVTRPSTNYIVEYPSSVRQYDIRTLWTRLEQGLDAWRAANYTASQ